MSDRQIGDDKLLYIPLSFLLPSVIIIISLILLQVVPFGSHNLAIFDGKYYLNGYAFLSRLLHGQENILYSLKNGLGNNEWSILSWGGMNPVLLLLYFATLETMPEVFTWIVVVNMAVCGLTMYLLLADVRGHGVSNLIFSTSYALMGFNVAYCYHYLFFIGPQLLPLVVLGIRKIWQGKSPLLYIVSLAVCIFFNFYFGFMLCVASLVVFFAFLYAEAESLSGKKWALTKCWLVSSVISGLLAAPMWLPAIKAFTGGGRIDQALSFGFSFSENMPFIQIFSKLFSGANSQAEQVDGLPFIFCGILVVALVILYFMNREISARRRRAAGLILGLYLLTFYISAFTKLMHGGTHTNWFNYRYSFVFSFFLICIAAEEFKYISVVTIQDVKRCGVALLVSTILVFSVWYEYISGGAVVLDLALLVIMWGLVICHRNKPQKLTKKVMSGLLLLAVSVNLFANFTISIKKMRDYETDLTLYKSNVLFSGGSVDALNAYEEGFFRMEKDVSESGTVGADPQIYGYNGVSLSGPAIRMFVHKQLNKLGINWYDMRHWYQAGAPTATDALLGLKYILASRSDIGEEKDYPKIVSTEENAVYQNPNALSVSILANEACADIELGNNAFENLNEVWKKMSGGDQDIFTIQQDVKFTLHNMTDSMSVTSEEIKTSVSNSAAGAEDNTQESAYIESEFIAEHTGPIYRFDTSVPESDYGSPNASIKYCGYYHEGDTVKDISKANTLSVTWQDFLFNCSHFVYAYADNSVVADYARQLNSRDITFNAVHDNQLTGTFTAEQNQRILFTIPWDEGWSCYIDGQKVPIHKTWDLFMSVEAPQGQHSYEMKFFPAWMDYGLILCGAAFIGLIIFMIVWKKSRSRASAGMEPENLTEESGPEATALEIDEEEAAVPDAEETPEEESAVPLEEETPAEESDTQ